PARASDEIPLVAGLPRFLIRQTVSFPEDTLGIPLYAGVGLGELEPFQRPAAIVSVELDAAIPAAKLLGNDGCRPAAKKRVEYHVTGMRACQNQFRDELFGLLRGVVGILRH